VAQGNPETALERDRRWHSRLLQGCNNALLLETVAALRNRAFRYELAYMRSSGRVITSVSQHRDIIDALRHDDRDTAIARLESNWQVSVDFLISWLSGEQTRSSPPRGRGVTPP
jgi:DNA-binding GntR family transcriptional regulator